MSKKCTKCGIEKPIEEFYKNKSKHDGHSSICKDCLKENDRSYYIRNKEKIRARAKKYHNMIKDYINDIKSHGCIICGENDVSCLDFHHLGDKIIEVSKLIGNDNFKLIKTEINKCVVLCSNCHRKLHFYKLDLKELKKRVCSLSAA